MTNNFAKNGLNNRLVFNSEVYVVDCNDTFFFFTFSFEDAFFCKLRNKTLSQQYSKKKNLHKQ